MMEELAGVNPIGINHYFCEVLIVTSTLGDTSRPLLAYHFHKNLAALSKHDEGWDTRVHW